MFLAYLIVYVFIYLILNREVGINQACGHAE